MHTINKDGSGSLDGTVNSRLRRVPLQDFVDAGVDIDLLSVRPDGEVCGDKCVHNGAGFEGEFVELACQPSFDCFESGAGVVGYQRRQSLRPAVRPKISGTVQGVHSSLDETWGVSDIVQPSRTHEHGMVGGIDCSRQIDCSFGDALHMRPSLGERSGVEQGGGESARLRDKIGHSLDSRQPRRDASPPARDRLGRPRGKRTSMTGQPI
jgi:hypothetical protein